MNKIKNISPWPTKHGNLGNTHVSSTLIKSKMKTIWSLKILDGFVSDIITSEDGGIFVTDDKRLVAINEDGTHRWSIVCEQYIGRPILLSDGTIFFGADNQIIQLDQKTGKEKCRIAVNDWVGAQSAVLSNNKVIYQYQSDGLISGGIKCIDNDLRVEWFYPLSDARCCIPLVLNNFIVIPDGSYIAVLDYCGNLNWLIDRNSFMDGQKAKNFNRFIENEAFTTPPMLLDDNKFVIGCEWYSGQALLICNLSEQSVKIWPNKSDRKIPFKLPLALIPGDEQLIAGAFWQELLVYDINGEIRFHKKLSLEIANLLADENGTIVVVTSVAQDYWEKYKEPYKMHDDCGLTGFDNHGNQIFKWIAPGPVAETIAVGRNGELYCVSENKLWAVG